MFYCPNCKKEVIDRDDIMHSNHDIVLRNLRDGTGRPLYHVICENCSYPLSAIVYLPKDVHKEDIEYYKSIITDYQNGHYEKKNNMLNKIIENHKKMISFNMENIKEYEKIIGSCNSFLEPEEE